MRPSLFISHGSPALVGEDIPARDFLTGLGRDLGRPSAILVASAHWETEAPRASTAVAPETIHDFYGFPEALYRLRYPAPGAPEVATRAVELLRSAGHAADVDPQQGLDHGAWSPLLYMYPQADVPVVQLAVQPALGPRHHIGLGRALRKLADEGVLVIGSGHMTHNLRDWARGAGQPQPYATSFQKWVKEKIEAHDYDSLADYRSLSPDGVRSHPTDEHFLPLFVALGAAPENTRAERIYDDIESGVLAMDAYVFGS